MVHSKFKYLYLSGWNNYPKIKCKTFRPEKISDVYDILIKENNIISRGQGKSYGDASINQNGVILTERLDKFLSFDKKIGIIKVQSGLMLSDLNRHINKEGWVLPVVPGTELISVGGAFACNVHGKNNYNKGSFADHVKEIKLITSNKKLITCSPSKNKDMFWSTAGGMGLTGIIQDLTIKLVKVNSTDLQVETIKVNNLSQMLEFFKKGKSTHEFMVGWIDCFGKGKKLGNGIFQKADFKQKNNTPIIVDRNKKFIIKVPFNFPSFLLNKITINFFNKFKLLVNSKKWKIKQTSMNAFLNPLDNIINWNKLYGKKGLLQYQFIIPDNNLLIKNLEKILTVIQKSKTIPFLTVIKLHKKSEGIISFPINGYSLACDFPNNQNTTKLIEQLNEHIIKFNGRVYLAKDTLLSENDISRMYKKDLKTWKKIISRVSENNIYNSMMSKRLNLKNE